MWPCWLSPFWNSLCPQCFRHHFLLLLFFPFYFFSSVSFGDSSIYLLNTIIPKGTILGLYLSLDIRFFLCDPRVSITINMQISLKSGVCVCVCVCNQIIFYLKTSAGSLLQQTFNHCHCILPCRHWMYLSSFPVLLTNYYSSFKTQFRCYFHHEKFLEISRQLIPLIALYPYLQHVFCV